MTDPVSPIALIGLGHMGGPIGARWTRSGAVVRGYDVSDHARAAFVERGGEPADTIANAVAGARTVILLLPDSRVVNAVIDDLLGKNALDDGVVVVDMSSSKPSETRRNAQRLAVAGVAFIDAPVSGGVRGAEAGSLTIMVGGPTSIVESRRALLGELGTVIHVGEVGCGHAVKALNNLLSATHLWATSEAVLIAERFGVAPETFLEVVNGSSGRSASSEAKWPKFILPETYDSGFSARLMLKDARIATGLADQLGLPTELGTRVVTDWARAVEDLPATADHTEIARWLRNHAEQE